jgi:hypothetical protein
MKKIITVKPDGTMKFVYDDKLKGLMEHGKATIKRASHVDPTEELTEEAKQWIRNSSVVCPGDELSEFHPCRWWADMLPSGGPVLGPFPTRQAALDAEVEWINDHVLTGVQP